MPHAGAELSHPHSPASRSIHVLTPFSSVKTLSFRGSLLPFLLVVSSVGPIGAQTTVTTSAGVTAAKYETRSALEEQARSAESQGRTSEAWLLRARLKSGDFQEGDRILMTLENAPGGPDTLQVRTGKVVQIPRMADLALEGVLRSEINGTLRSHLSRYLRNPEVRAIPLLSIAVMGSVNTPGYYYTAADVVLRDVLMQAGGPAGNADLNRIVIRRGGETIWKSTDVRVALNEGLSLDRLHLRAGDEVFLPSRRGSFSNIIAIASTGSALVFALLALVR
jgi:protein involved in polysaccharide export with SLBB domain